MGEKGLVELRCLMELAGFMPIAAVRWGEAQLRASIRGPWPRVGDRVPVSVRLGGVRVFDSSGRTVV